MANTKKYVSLDKLGLYDEKIKEKIAADDATTLASAKSYADGLASNYDAAGAAATVQGKLDAEITRAKGEEARIEGLVNTAQGEVDALEEVVATKADKTALEGFQTTVSTTYETKTDATNKLTEAKGYTDAEVLKVQGEVNTLKGKVGTVADDTTVVAMIEAVDGKADKNAGDIVTINETIKNIQENAYDDTELRGLISDNTAAIEELEKTHGTDKKALEDAIALKADKTALDEVSAVANAAATKVALEAEVKRATDEEARIEGLVTAEKERAMGVEGGLEDRIETMEAFWEAAAADGTDNNVIDTLKEIQEYIAGDETGASEMLASIKQNKDAIEAMDTAYKAADVTLQGNIDKLAETVATKAAQSDLEALEGRMDDAEEALGTVDTRIATAITNANLDQYATDTEMGAAVERIAALETADGVQDGLIEGLRTDVDGKVAQGDFDTLSGKVTTVEGKVATLEGKFGDGEGSVSDMIADAKTEAINAAAAAADTKDAEILAQAKKYADDEDAKIEERVGALETASATHALASDLTALDGRVTTAEGEIDTLQTEMDAVELLAAANKAAHEANATAIATKAAQADLEALDGRVVTLETWHNNFTEVSEEEINALFN